MHGRLPAPTLDYPFLFAQKFVSKNAPSLPRWVYITVRQVRCAARKRRCSDMPLSLEDKVRLLSMVDVFESLLREELEELAHRARDTHLE